MIRALDDNRSTSLTPNGDATIELREEIDVASLLALMAVVKDTGAPRSLLYASVNWGKLQGTARPAFGAPAPSVARATHTRAARREQRQRQLARRSGTAALVRSLRSL